MDSDTLTIVLFLFGAALLLVVEAVNSGGRKRVGFSAGAACFVLLGLAWEPLSKLFPQMAGWVGQVATFPPSWFILLSVIYLVVRDWWTKKDTATATDIKVELVGAKADAAQSTADGAINRLMELSGSLQALDGKVDKLVEAGKGLSPPRRASDIRMLMFNGNIFSPTSRPTWTGLALDARVWNLGEPMPIVSWSLGVVVPGAGPKLAQLTKMPDTLKLGGEVNSAIVRASSSLEAKAMEPVTTTIIEGTLLFYVALPKTQIEQEDTRLELTATALDGKEAITSLRLGDWLSA